MQEKQRSMEIADKPSRSDVALSRRALLKAGLKVGMAGSLLLAGGGLVQGCSSSAQREPVTVYRNQNPITLQFLRQPDVVLLSAIIPAVLAGNFPAAPAEQQRVLTNVLIGLDDFLGATSAYTHQQVHQLFDLLSMKVSRGLLTGVWADWSAVDTDEVERFLRRWQHSRFNTFRQGYQLLTQLPTLVYYAQPPHWTPAIYPGPPSHQPTPVAIHSATEASV